MIGARTPIGVFRASYPVYSETFIQAQTRHLMRYDPLMLVRSLLAETEVPHLALSRPDILGLRQRLFTVTRARWLFGRSQALRRLKLIHAHFGPDGALILPLARSLGVPLVVTLHGYDATLSLDALRALGGYGIRHYTDARAEFLRETRRFVAVSGFIADRLADQGFPAEKIVVHHIGVDLQRFVPGDAPPAQRYILCVARHTEKKGIDTVLEAFASIAPRAPGVALWLAGDGPLSASLQAQAQALGLGDRVVFLGAVPSERLLPIMQGAEAVVLGSRQAPNGDCEGLPIVLLEAGACGVPVVATAHAGAADAVLTGETGFLVPEGDGQAMAERLLQLCAAPALRRALGDRARAQMLRHFDIVRQTAALEAIYDDVLG